MKKIKVFILGIIISLILIEIGVCLGDFLHVSLQEYRNRIFIRSKGAYRIKRYKLAEFLWYNVIERFLGKGFQKGTNKKEENNIAPKEKVLLDDERKIDLIIDCIEDGKYEEFDEHLNNILEENSISGAGYSKLRKLFKHLQKRHELKGVLEEIYERTEGVLKRYISAKPANYTAYLGLGKLYLEMGQYEKARDILNYAVALNEGDYYAYLELGRVYIEIKQYEKAIELFEKVIDINHSESKAYLELIKIYGIKKEDNKVKEIFTRAMENDISCPNLYFEK